MTSGCITSPHHFDAYSLATRDCSARPSLKPSSAARGVVDGAWWPRSTDPAEMAAPARATVGDTGPEDSEHPDNTV